MKRVFNFMTAVSALLLLGLCALWFGDRGSVQYVSPRTLGFASLSAFVEDSRLYAGRLKVDFVGQYPANYPPGPTGLSWHGWAWSIEYKVNLQKGNWTAWFGFALNKVSFWSVPVATETFTGITVPAPLLFAVLSLLPAICSILRLIHRKRQREGFCRACNYDLTGNTSGVCPECGMAVSRKSEGSITVKTQRSYSRTSKSCGVAIVVHMRTLPKKDRQKLWREARRSSIRKVRTWRWPLILLIATAVFEWAIYARLLTVDGMIDTTGVMLFLSIAASIGAIADQRIVMLQFLATRFVFLCRSCGYNLTGNTSGVCPECGTPVSRKS